MGDIVGDLLQPAHQCFDSFEHRVDIVGEPVELIAGAGDRQTTGEVAGHDRLRSPGHGVDPAQHAAADKESTDQAEHDHQRERPLTGVDDDAKQAFALLKVAADQEMKPARELHYPDQRPMLGAFGRFQPMVIGFEPARMIEHARLQ